MIHHQNQNLQEKQHLAQQYLVPASPIPELAKLILRVLGIAEQMLAKLNSIKKAGLSQHESPAFST